MVRNGEGQSSLVHILVFHVNFERHICTHITISIIFFCIVKGIYMCCSLILKPIQLASKQPIFKMKAKLHHCIGILQKKFLACKSTID